MARHIPSKVREALTGQDECKRQEQHKVTIDYIRSMIAEVDQSQTPVVLYECRMTKNAVSEPVRTGNILNIANETTSTSSGKCGMYGYTLRVRFL